MPETILVVDDEADVEPLFRQIFRRQIRQEKLHFLFAHNGLEALAQLQSGQLIDIVLTDIRMPKMDGLALLTKIGELKPTLNPVLTTAVLSAYDDMTNIRKAMNAGAFDFLHKPLDYEDLRITVEKLVQHVQQFKQAQEMVRRTQNELEHAYAALEAANQRLHELDKLKSDFIEVVTHEIRSPFVKIAFSLGMLEQQSRSQVSPEFFTHLTELHENIRRAQQMADNLVNFAQFLGKQGELQPRMVDFVQVVEDGLLPLRGVAQSEGVVLQVDWGQERPLLLADPEPLSDAIFHLVHNAIRFTPPGGEVGVRVYAQAERAAFAVRDSGAGIAPDKLPLLWQGLAQLADPVLRKVEGLGLGLSLVKYIVQAHGGDVFAESEPGRGSTFGFYLPL